MRFDVGFIIHIDTILVTQFIEFPVLRIVTQTNGIDIMLFHQFKVFPHQLFRHIMARLRIMFVNVDTLEFHRLTVEQQYRIGLTITGQLVNLLDLDPAETNMIRNDFRYLTIHLDRHQQFV